MMRWAISDVQFRGMNHPKVARNGTPPVAGAPITCSFQRGWPSGPASLSPLFFRQLRRAFGENPMSALRLDQILASAAVALILAAPISALGQQTEPSNAVPTDQSKAGDTPPGQPPIAAPASAAQTAPPASTPEQVPAADPLAALDPADRVVAERLRALSGLRRTRWPRPN